MGGVGEWGQQILTQIAEESVWDTTKDLSSKHKEYWGFASARADSVCRRHTLLPLETHG